LLDHPLFTTPPREVCILRLSAIGDVCHVLAVVRTLQQAWPETRFTWVIGKLEARLLKCIPEIEFIVFDKSQGLRAYLELRRVMQGRQFDLVLHMQLALRASVASALIPARIKLGFDRTRARELQWLFTNERIRPSERQHVLDGLFGFADQVGVHDRLLRWDIPVGTEALEHAARVIPEGQPTLVISPCSSHTARNWRPEYYAQVADHAASKLGLKILLCGGPSPLERQMGDAILASMREPCTDLIGKDTLPALLATLARATALLTPDSGPAHMATAVGTPVIGLYAATNPARSGPYLSRQWCVDRYDAAARKYLHKPAADIPWTTKIEEPGVMDLIQPDDVIKKLSGILTHQTRYPPSR
jgi:heptosyltransferase I